MKIALIGASGWIGSTIAQEALARGHQVIGIGRDTTKISDAVQIQRQFDLTQPNGLEAAIADADIVIASIGGRAANQHQIVANTAQRLLAELPNAGVQRLLWVGGAGSLEIAPGVSLVSQPSFPEAYRAEALAQGEALAVFRSSTSPLQWTFISPAAEIFPGERRGEYRVGGDQLLQDAAGNSRISVQDFAVALIDEAEAGTHLHQRMGVAY